MSTAPEFEYELAVVLDPNNPRTELMDDELAEGEISEEKAARARLHNLGYASGESLEDKVRAFQSDCGQKPTGQLERRATERVL